VGVVVKPVFPKLEVSVEPAITGRGIIRVFLDDKRSVIRIDGKEKSLVKQFNKLIKEIKRVSKKNESLNIK
jgi:cell division septal protein FtsQ